MTLTSEQRSKINEFVGNYDCISLRDDYSGRCMYGKTCIGLDIDDMSTEQVCMELAIFLVKEDEEELAERLSQGIRTDSMGLGSIVYWPYIKWGEETEETQEDKNED